MKEIFKISLLLSIIVLSLSTIGCSDIDSQDKNNHEINNKEKQEISLADILDRDNVTPNELENVSPTFDELENAAINYLGKDSESDTKSNYVIYANDYIEVPISLQGTFPDISELNEDEINNDIKKVKYLNAFYKFIKNEYSNFIATNLTKENVLDDFNKLEMKYKEFIHRSYIEGKSEQAMMAYFDMTMAVQKEGIYVRDLIDINKNKKNKSERKSILDEINKSHSEVRSNNDIKLQNYYKNIIEKVS